MSWADFTTKVREVANSRGHRFIVTATTPNPEAATIDVGYVIRVEPGQDGYVNTHGQRYEI